MLKIIPRAMRMWLYRAGLLKPKMYWEPVIMFEVRPNNDRT